MKIVSHPYALTNCSVVGVEHQVMVTKNELQELKKKIIGSSKGGGNSLSIQFQHLLVSKTNSSYHLSGGRANSSPKLLC